MREVLYSKLVFLDSHDGVRGRKSLTPSYHIPANAFSCGQGESMRLVLKHFTMPKAFYNINKSNNTFFYRDTGNNSNVELNLAPGNYTATELAAEIQRVVRGTGALSAATFTCTYDAKTRKLTMTIPSASPSGYFVSYFDKRETSPEFYSDANEVLGGTPTTDVANPVNMFNGNAHTNGGGNTTVESKYPIRLNTIENLYLRCSAQGDAFCSTTYEPKKTGNKLDACDIWASIPNIENAEGNIVLTDNSEDFQIYIKHGQLTDLKFAVSDGKGRELPLVADSQAEDGNLNFNLCFKFEIMSEQHEPTIVRPDAANEPFRHPPKMSY